MKCGACLNWFEENRSCTVVVSIYEHLHLNIYIPEPALKIQMMSIKRIILIKIPVVDYSISVLHSFSFNLNIWKSQVTSNSYSWNCCVLFACLAKFFIFLCWQSQVRNKTSWHLYQYLLIHPFSIVLLKTKWKGYLLDLGASQVFYYFLSQLQILRVCDQKLINFLVLWFKFSLIYPYSLTPVISVVYMCCSNVIHT